MANPYIIYNDVKSTNIGVIMTRLPDFHRAARQISQVEIPGSSTPLMIDEGGYTAYQTQMQINANGVDLRDLYAWLSGEGWMISSDEPKYKAYVYLYSQIDDRRLRVGGDCYDTLTVPVLVEPFLREKNETEIDMDEPGLIEGDGNVASLPRITVWGSGDINLMVNEQTVLFSGIEDRITIDCEAGIAYRSGGGERAWMGEHVTLVDDWPQMKAAGENNEINWSGNVERVRVHPNWRYL